MSQVYNKSFPLNKKGLRKRNIKHGLPRGLRIPLQLNTNYVFKKIPTVFNETNYKRYTNKRTQLIKNGAITIERNLTCTKVT